MPIHDRITVVLKFRLIKLLLVLHQVFRIGRRIGVAVEALEIVILPHPLGISATSIIKPAKVGYKHSNGYDHLLLTDTSLYQLG